MNKWLALAFVFLAVAVAGLVHQQLWAGEWFSWGQFWHHEPLIAITLAVSLCFLAVYLVERRRKNGQG